MAEYEGSDREEFWNGWLRDVPFPDFMPTYDKLLVDRLGHLWVREYQPSWEDSRTWFTFAPDGRGLGEVGVGGMTGRVALCRLTCTPLHGPADQPKAAQDVRYGENDNPDTPELAHDRFSFFMVALWV